MNIFRFRQNVQCQLPVQRFSQLATKYRLSYIRQNVETVEFKFKHFLKPTNRSCFLCLVEKLSCHLHLFPPCNLQIAKAKELDRDYYYFKSLSLAKDLCLCKVQSANDIYFICNTLNSKLNSKHIITHHSSRCL
jgi:hypothetical protein